MNKYIFRDYDPIYPKLFEDEKRRLVNFLPQEVNIEHFGSTAVAGLGGKGIIDIYVTVSKSLIQKTFKAIEEAGYEFRPGAGTAKRNFFRRIVANANGLEQRYHIHLVDDKNTDFIKDIEFRDYLRTHTDDLKKYADIKKKAAIKADNDKDKYMKIKEPIIKEILAKASAV